MELVKLMQSISNNNPPKYSIWFGEEQKILDIYLSKIADIGYKIVHCDSVSSVLSRIDKKSLDKSVKAYVVIEDSEYTNKEDKWESVKDIVNSSKHILILRYANINKTRKFYTRNKEICVEFNRLDTSVLINYILNIIPELPENNAEKLCNMCGNDYGRILLECDKITHYMNATKLKAVDAFAMLINQDAIYADIGDITFELTDAVLYGDLEKAGKVLQEAKLKNEPSMVIASILYNGFRNMLAYQGLGKDKSNPGIRTGLTGWQIQQVKKNIGGYSNKELVRNMIICQEVESGIKKGLIDEDVALDYLVVSCLQ